VPDVTWIPVSATFSIRDMSKPTARNALVVIGIWTLSRVIASLLETLIIVIHNQMTFTGDAETVMMWLWEGFPDDLVAVLATITLVWVIETRKPLAWVSGLAALYLYGGGLHAWRTLAHLRHEPPRTPDYIGILMQASIPALVCLVAGVWWTRRSVALKAVAT
jgi:hypothetical protein